MASGSYWFGFFIDCTPYRTPGEVGGEVSSRGVRGMKVLLSPIRKGSCAVLALSIRDPISWIQGQVLEKSVTHTLDPEYLHLVGR